MDVIVEIAKSLGGMNLGVILGIGIFFVFLILLILKGSILQTGLRIFTKKKFGFYFMIMPTFLAIFTNMILLFASYLVITFKFDINILDLTIQFLFNTLTDFQPIIYILLVLLIAEVLFIIIQAFILKLVTFDLSQSIKKLFRLITKKGSKTAEKLDNNEDNAILENSKPEESTQLTSDIVTRPSYVSGLLAGLFCFSIMVFLTIILLYIGEMIGSKLSL